MPPRIPPVAQHLENPYDLSSTPQEQLGAGGFACRAGVASAFALISLGGVAHAASSEEVDLRDQTGDLAFTPSVIDAGGAGFDAFPDGPSDLTFDYDPFPSALYAEDEVPWPELSEPLPAPAEQEVPTPDTAVLVADSTAPAGNTGALTTTDSPVDPTPVEVVSESSVGDVGGGDGSAVVFGVADEVRLDPFAPTAQDAAAAADLQAALAAGPVGFAEGSFSSELPPSPVFEVAADIFTGSTDGPGVTGDTAPSVEAPVASPPSADVAAPLDPFVPGAAGEPPTRPTTGGSGADGDTGISATGSTPPAPAQMDPSRPATPTSSGTSGTGTSGSATAGTATTSTGTTGTGSSGTVTTGTGTSGTATTGREDDPTAPWDAATGTSTFPANGVGDSLRGTFDVGEGTTPSPIPTPAAGSSAVPSTNGNGGPGPVLSPDALPYVFALSPLSVGINAYENGTVIGAKRAAQLRAAGAPAAVVAAAMNPLNNVREAATTLPRASVVDATLQNLPIDLPSTGNDDLDSLLQSGISGGVGAGTNMAAQYIQGVLPEMQRRNTEFYLSARSGTNVTVPTPRPITLALPARPLPYAAAPIAINTAVIVDREVRDHFDICQPSSSDTSNLNTYCDIAFRSVAKGVGLQAAFAGDSLADQWALARRLSPGRALRETAPLVGTMAAQNAIAELLVVDPVVDDPLFQGLRNTAQTLSDVGTGANYVVNAPTDSTDGAGVNLTRGYANAALAVGMPAVEAVTNAVDPVWTAANFGQQLTGGNREPLVSRAGIQEADRRLEEASRALSTGLRQTPTTASGAVGSAVANTLDGLGDAMIGTGTALTSFGSPDGLAAAQQRFRESGASFERAGNALGVVNGAPQSSVTSPLVSTAGSGGSAGSECAGDDECAVVGSGAGGPGAVSGSPVPGQGASVAAGGAVTVVAPVVGGLSTESQREQYQRWLQSNSAVGSGSVGTSTTPAASVPPPASVTLVPSVTAAALNPELSRDEPAVAAPWVEVAPVGSGVGSGVVGSGVWSAPSVSSVSSASAAPSAVRSGPIALRPDVRYPVCSTSVTSGCVEQGSLRDDNGDGVADNAGVLRPGARIVGEGIVGPRIVGEGIVGEGIVGPRIVGEGIVGEGIVGPGPVRQAANFVEQNVVRPVAGAITEANRRVREMNRTTVIESRPLDGFMGVNGVTRHEVSFADGGRGIYNPQGRLLTVQSGNPPSQINSTALYLRGIGGGGGGQVIPGAPGAPGLPRMAPRFAPI
ncbi:MAG: hypothetical protein AVDCRST_MAG66-2817 [uncultured Pseudonocardia sp.]|uniref:Uncharacterized protein n=1 Tax=uncultured Pseudonocardia sp. TaxID=211455 RepID=A0A6J4PS25_9PSEU|nr:MAG: hypothetical protein AVDCRST_MAG66-2817 [uncultured Pseudonocardia sp.]